MALASIQIIPIILLASLVLLIDSSMLMDTCNHYRYGCGSEEESKINWAIACSCISLIVCLLYAMGIRTAGATVSAYTSYFAIFLLLWWTFGVGVLTFDSPYAVASNGYLSSWAAWCLSFYFCTRTVGAVENAYSQAVESERERFTVGVLLIASFIEVIEASVLCSKDNECVKEVAFAVAAGVISIAVCFIYQVTNDAFPLVHAAIILFVWWTICTGVLTFGAHAPFKLVGNGYLSTWVSFGASFYLCHLGFGLGEKLAAVGANVGGGGEEGKVGGEDGKYEVV